MKLRLTCTSYLLPGNPSWKTVNNNVDLKFGEFGDWPQILTGNSDECDGLCWVIFLEDLISKDLLFSEIEEDFKKAETVVDSAFNALSFWLRNNPEKYTFIAWLGWQPDNNIRFARKKTLAMRITEYFSTHLNQLMEENNRLFLIPLDIIFGEEGYKKCLDSRNFFLSRTRLSQKGIKILSEALNNVLLRINTPASKLLVLDCDNTLWGGVIGENGIGGIKIGQDGIGAAFSAFQIGIKQLAKNGLLIGISSKNDEKDVLNVFESHSSMVLKNQDLIIKKIDWRDKSIHLNEIAQEIGIGLESIIFWDDNPIEREKVKQSLPNVIVVEPPIEVVEWYDTLRGITSLSSFTKSKEDFNKVSQYKAKAEFESETNLFGNYNDFLLSTNMEPTIIEINESTIGRAVQLVQKTNQLNLRLKRHDEFVLTNFLQKEKSVGFLIHLKDKYGDHGIVALVIAYPAEKPNNAFLDTFLMSCRVLGRNLEGWIFEQLRLRLLKHGFENLEAEYIYGERNTPAKAILSNYQFDFIEIRASGEDKIESFIIKLDSWKIQNLDLFHNKNKI